MQQRTAVGKMSDDRLRSKLVQAGYQADDVARLERHALILTYAACLADEEDARRTRAAVDEAEGADVFAEAVAVVFRETDQQLTAEQEVENVQQFAGDDQAVGNAQQGAEGGHQGEDVQAAAMSLEERRLRLDERRLQMEEQRWKAELEERKAERKLKEKKEEAERKKEEAERKKEQAERNLDSRN